MGVFPESLSQAMLVGCNVSREIGRTARPARSAVREQPPGILRRECAFCRGKDRHSWLHHSPRLKKPCVRRVVLDTSSERRKSTRRRRTARSGPSPTTCLTALQMYRCYHYQDKCIYQITCTDAIILTYYDVQMLSFSGVGRHLQRGLGRDLRRRGPRLSGADRGPPRGGGGYTYIYIYIYIYKETGYNATSMVGRILSSFKHLT